MYQYDYVIIGAGPAGYVGALKAAMLEKRVCLVERANVGGVCLNEGCIPSKSLISQAETYSSLSRLKGMGIECDTLAFDYRSVFERSRLAAERLSQGIEHLLGERKVDLVKGTAEITSAHEVVIDGEQAVSAQTIIIATGSAARELPDFPFDEHQLLSSRGFLFQKELPESLCILGAGAIGCEAAYIMNSFGVKVTLLELKDRILPLEDVETSRLLARSFKKQGITIKTSVRATGHSKDEQGVTIRYEDGKGREHSLQAQRLLICAGRVPMTDTLGLAELGITTESGFIPVDEYCRTSVDSIYAVGDCIRGPQLAHAASREAEVAVLAAAGLETQERPKSEQIISAVYTVPQVASFGIPLSQLEAEKRELRRGSFPFLASGRAVASGHTDGQVIVYADERTDQILRASIVGPQASELIHGLYQAAANGIPASRLAETIYAHPTYSEAIGEALLSLEGKAIHIL